MEKKFRDNPGFLCVVAIGNHSNQTVFICSGADIEQEPVSLQERCKRYYRDSYKFYEDYFLKCLEEIEDLQPSGFACIQVSRYFTVGVLPKYCVIPDPLTRKERDRVERIMGS